MSGDTHKYTDLRETDRPAMTLGPLAAQLCASLCHYSRPTIVVHPSMMGAAEQVGKELAYNVEGDDSLAEIEWFVKWGVNAYGSTGE